MNKYAWVRLEKKGETENPKAPAGNPDEYLYGQENPTVSIPIEYWVEGILMVPPTPGKQVVVYRFIRNGVDVEGLFSSTLVVNVGKGEFSTHNSRYVITEKAIPPEYQKRVNVLIRESKKAAGEE